MTRKVSKTRAPEYQETATQGLAVSEEQQENFSKLLAESRREAEEAQRKHEAYVERQLAAAEAQARGLEALAHAIAGLAVAITLRKGDGAPPPKAPAVIAERPARAERAEPKPAAPAAEKPASKEDVRRVMVAVAKARGGDFLTAFLKDHFGCESIAGLRPEQYEEVFAVLTAVVAKAALAPRVPGSTK